MSVADTNQLLREIREDRLPDAKIKPRPKEEIVGSEEILDGELFLFDGSKGVAHQLNGGATLVWVLCDGERNLTSIAKEIAETYSLPESEVLVQVQESVAHFQKIDLLE